jgi:hypothetical protein
MVAREGGVLELLGFAERVESSDDGIDDTGFLYIWAGFLAGPSFRSNIFLLGSDSRTR